ncbi:MAG: monovalent cation/H+ antiporter subunit A, partial [Proteobacteria bacterium]|nr:monovalent cation/H+ antiporter subunit A [Pseudomonadota bacterium]
SLGLELAFSIDGLGLLFGLLISGVGGLVLIYAGAYLGPHRHASRLQSFLLVFMGSMLGVVWSENLLGLFVFWELTSISSYLLIGFDHERPAARAAALKALLVTGGGGLCLLVAVLMLGSIGGSYDLGALLDERDTILASPWLGAIVVLVCLGAFTKSAQFPFHFWLPHAMAAPTPVSAYLHSATMVKAGLFLMARLWPVLSGTDAWFLLVGGAGLITMVLGAVIALFKDDLKALLAFSTVSHLGLITMLLGLGTEFGAVAAVFHIINHATFKAALFMTAGIVDHEAHTRDIRRLGGLRHLMPVTFVIAAIASLSMAGIPAFNGFLSKEMMLEAAWDTGTVFAVLATLGALFSVGYSLRFLVHSFAGPVRDDYPHTPRDPGAGLWLPPALLAALVVLIGFFPQTMVGGLVKVIAGAVTAGDPVVYIKHWHGFVPALWMSVAAVIGGALLLARHGGLARAWDAAPRPEAKAIFDALVEALARAARRFTDGLHDGAVSRYLAILTAAVLAYGAWSFAGATHGPGLRIATPVSVVPVIFAGLLVAASVALAVLHRQRFVALVVISIVGLVVSMAFVHFSAPDLALTQLTVEVVTIVLLLLALNYLPKVTPQESPAGKRLMDGLVAAGAGLGVAALTSAFLSRDRSLPTIADYHLENSYTGGGGTNVVNVILVDFRGFDTMGEIIVLGIAALVIYALVDGLLHGPASRRLSNRIPDMAQAGDRHPLMMVVATRVALPIALAVAVFIFLRGHNEPGGGFIAGLVAAIALLMQYMASGFAWSEARQRFDYHGVIAAGVAIAVLTGVASILLGWNFLTSTNEYVKVWPLSKVHLASAIAFDLGVFLTVVGSVMLALASLSRIGRHAGEGVNLTPMDINPESPAQPVKETH